MFVLALVNQKGGCGKTTVAVNLAGALAERGYSTLLVDLDPQAHATMALGHAPRAGEELTVLDVLAGDSSVDEAAVAASGGVWLLPAALELAEFEDLAARLLQPERLLAERLEAARASFDFVLLDCPPRVDGVLTANALRACDCAVLVVETGAFALQGALAAQRILLERHAQEEHAFGLRVLATMFDRRLRIAREILVALQARFGPALFDTAIRESVRLREVAALGAPVQVIDPSSRSCEDFRSLAAEVLALAAGEEARETESCTRASAADAGAR
jgi:chromosome partitioning protein